MTGDNVNEKIKLIFMCSVLCVLFFTIYMCITSVYDYVIPDGEIERELDISKRYNKEAGNISTEVSEGIGVTAKRLGRAAERTDRISKGIGNLQIEAKKTGRDLRDAGALIEESLLILKEIEKTGKSH